MEEAPGFPSISNMADGNRSAKGKAVVVDDEIGSTSGHKGSHGNFSSHGGSRAVDRRDGGYSADDLLPTNFDYNGISTSSLPSTHMDSRMYTHQYVDPGYYWPTGHGGGSTASFPLPFGGAGIPGPQHVRTGNQLFTGIRSTTQHYELYHSANANDGRGGATFSSPHIGDDGMHCAPHHAPNSGRPRSPPPWSMEHIDSFIGNSLRSLSVQDRGGRRLSEFVNNLQEPQDLVGTDGQNNHPAAAASLGHGRLLNNADQLYVGRRLEDVRGTMSSVARNPPGCRFLVRMVAEGGAATAQQVLDEVTGDVVRLMVHADGHALVEALVQHLTDDHMARVLEILDAASPAQILAVARSHQA